MNNVKGDMISNKVSNHGQRGDNFNGPTNHTTRGDENNGTFNGGNYGGHGVGGNGTQGAASPRGGNAGPQNVNTDSASASRPRGGNETPQDVNSPSATPVVRGHNAQGTAKPHGKNAVPQITNTVPDSGITDLELANGHDLAKAKNPVDLLFKMSALITEMHSEFAEKVEELNRMHSELAEKVEELNRMRKDNDKKVKHLEVAFRRIVEGIAIASISSKESISETQRN
ncbi:hypothetical protein BDQ17DRAFT_1434970 [Cyathus striatus]|nr:hypothetical protein BDQ17DRAFT_1434970 [Cyathus striatus]